MLLQYNTCSGMLRGRDIKERWTFEGGKGIIALHIESPAYSKYSLAAVDC